MRWRGANPEYEKLEGSLQQQLDELKARARPLVSPATTEAQERAIEELRQSGLAGRILPVGALAPAFELPDSNGKIFRSVDLLARGRLVISFFRGRWCPYCITELEAWEHARSEVEAAGASLIAISPQTPRQTSFLVDQHRLSFLVLCDAANRVARAFGLIHSLPEYLRQIYQRSFINLPNSNGDSSWELPLPATYVLERDALVLFASADPDYTRRPDPAVVLRVLAS